MKKLSSYIFLLLLLVNLQSCFHLTETLSLNRDGSGLYTFTLDLSPLMTEDETMWDFMLMNWGPDTEIF